MEWVETTGRSVAEALDLALDQLGVGENDVEYEIVEEPKTGLFRRGEARVRARVRPVSREKPQDKRRRSGSGNGSGSSGFSRAPSSQRSTRGTKQSERSGASRQPRQSREKRAMHNEGANVDTQVSSVPVGEQADIAVRFIQGLVEAFGAVGKADSTIDEEDTIWLSVEGTGLGYLVGHRGYTLGAVEELTRTVVQRHTDGRGARINLDIASYRAKRREALIAFVTEVAAKVVESGTSRALEPMSAADRKAVHDTVAEIGGVTTTSEGEDRRRRVVILPE